MKKGLFRLGVVAVLCVMITGVFAQTLTRDERAEIRFLEGMIDHHQMALDMANHCLGKTQNADLKALCQAVIEAQTPEIQLMQEWLLAWYNIQYESVSMVGEFPKADNNPHAGHGAHSSSTEPFKDMPMMMGMMAGFDRYEGVTYDMAWLESMIDHHDDALHMSERILGRIVHDELGTLAQAIIDAQTAEIAMMEAMLEALN